MSDATEIRIDGLEKRMDRRDKEVGKEQKETWNAIEKIRDQYDTLLARLERLPAWAIVVFGALTMLNGLMGGWLAKSIFN